MLAAWLTFGVGQSRRHPETCGVLHGEHTNFRVVDLLRNLRRRDCIEICYSCLFLLLFFLPPKWGMRVPTELGAPHHIHICLGVPRANMSSVSRLGTSYLKTPSTTQLLIALSYYYFLECRENKCFDVALRQQPRMSLYQSVHSSIVGPRFFHHSVRRPQIRDEDIPFHLISIASSGASARVCRWNWKCSWLTLFVVVCMLHVKKRSALPSVFQPDSRPPRPLPRAPSSLSPNGLSYYCCLSLDQLTHSEMMDM